MLHVLMVVAPIKQTACDVLSTIHHVFGLYIKTQQLTYKGTDISNAGYITVYYTIPPKTLGAHGLNFSPLQNGQS